MNKDETMLTETITMITPVEPEMIVKAQARLDSLTKPRRSLGRLEDIAARYRAIRCDDCPLVGGKRVVVFAGDHCVVEEGVSAYPASVTGLMVRNFLSGGAAINVLARRAGAEVEVVDVGMAEDLGPLPGLRRENVKRAAANIARGPAMTKAEVVAALGVGIRAARRAADDGVVMVGTGDMGIGNTTPAAALLAMLLDAPPERMVGPGTGLDRSGVERKTEVVKRALSVNRPLCRDPLSTLAALGGLEIAAISGLCLGGAALRLAVVVDGFIAAAGALAAVRLCPTSTDYMFFAHRSAEPGHQAFYDAIGQAPLLDLGMRLGEGTGAAIAMQIIEDAVAIHNEMATFEQAGITPGA